MANRVKENKLACDSIINKLFFKGLRNANAYLLILVTSLPVILTLELWRKILGGELSLAWDGSGHQALAQIYSQTVFPDTFGWTNLFFGGMPHPNFYPPLFYWLVALLHYIGLSFTTAFKLILVFPPLCLPACIWGVTWRVTGKNHLAATCAAFAVIPLLVDNRFYNGPGLLTGLSYTSTFLFGLYTQPLGFFLLLAWYFVYSGDRHSTQRFVLASLLLALALLGNFFAANVAALLVAANIASDTVRLYRAKDVYARRSALRSLTSHVCSPFVAGLLTLFWIVPVISAGQYFPSSPSYLPLYTLFSPTMTAWYVLALAGCVLWARSTTAGMWPYLTTCLVMAVLVVLSSAIAPAWLPLHAERLLTMLNFLLAAPVGYLLATVLARLVAIFNIGAPASSQAGKKRGHFAGPRLSTSPSYTLAVLILVAVCIAGALFITPPSFRLSFYQDGDSAVLDAVLLYGREHRDGRYMIETPPFSDTVTAHEGRAMGAYLAAQGNEVASVFFREASPSIIFFNSLVRSMSVYGDATNISSVLIDDKDFVAQPFAKHLTQAQLLGIRHLVIRSPWAKSRLEGQPGIKSRVDFGTWSVYELAWGPFEQARALPYKPALVITGLSVKQRRVNQYEFVRLAEEQFADGWYDVLLARSPETKIDRVDFDNGFGALVVETYDCDDEDAAFTKLREYSIDRPLILLSSDSPLFKRLQAHLNELPGAVIIQRPTEQLGDWLNPGPPTRSYETNSVRKTWREIRKVLDERKVPTGAESMVSGEASQESIYLEPRAALPSPVPVLVNTTYFPHWQRSDGGAIYAATPFFMLTFVQSPTRLVFSRRPYERVGVALSAVTLLAVCIFGLWPWHKLVLRLPRGGAPVKGVGRSP